MTDDLALAVSALTDPQTRKLIDCTCVEHGGKKSHVFVDEPLLIQLEAAVTSAIGGGGGGGSATGSVLNDEALYRFAVIRAGITDMCRIVRANVTKDLVTDLRAWQVGFAGQNQEAAFYTRQLEGWAATITELLDPPKRVPLAGPCPVCHADHWFGVDGSRRASPVAVEYDHANPYRSVKAVCRAGECGAEWVGADSVEELVEEMTERGEA